MNYTEEMNLMRMVEKKFDKMENVFEICDEKTERPIEILDILR